MAAATIPSSHQWLPVTITAYMVNAGWSTTSQRQRLLDATSTPTATSTAHPTWMEGMAASWLDSPLPPTPYTDCP
jgi:hypothetical protein